MASSTERRPMSSDANGILMPGHEMYLQVTAAPKRYHEAMEMGAQPMRLGACGKSTMTCPGGH